MSLTTLLRRARPFAAPALSAAPGDASIVEAVEARDGGRAEDLMRSHVLGVAHRHLDVVAEDEFLAGHQ